MKVISVVNQKGGTGKTTTVINLSAYLALKGYRVLVVDFDPQANASSGLGVFAEKGVYELITKNSDFPSLINQVKENLYLLPATANLAGASVELVNIDNREKALSQCLAPFLKEFDFVLIDTPPSLGLLTINSLTVSSFVLIPLQAEYYALEGLSQLMKTIDLVKENLRPSLSILGTVITMYDERSRLPKEVLENLYQNFPYYIFKTVIPRNVRLAETPSFGSSIFNYAPSSRGAKSYRRLGEEFLFYLENDLKQPLD